MRAQIEVLVLNNIGGFGEGRRWIPLGNVKRTINKPKASMVQNTCCNSIIRFLIVSGDLFYLISMNLDIIYTMIYFRHQWSYFSVRLFKASNVTLILKICKFARIRSRYPIYILWCPIPVRVALFCQQYYCNTFLIL